MLSQPAKLNLNAMRGVYAAQGNLTDSDFDALVTGTAKINALGLGVIWQVPYLARDLHADITWSVHLQAWAAALQLPYSGIDDFYRRAIAAGVLDPWLLNQTTFYEAPSAVAGLPLGRLLIRLGLISVIDLERALGIQIIIHHETGLPTRIGRILGQLAPVSVPDYTRAIALQLGVPYVNLEQTLPVIERAIKTTK
jgi:hypothetical protein